MTLRARYVILLILLGGAVAVQAAVYQHLRAAGTLPQVPLQKPLTEFPRQLGDWAGPEDTPITDPELLYADEHLQRTYENPKDSQTVVLWMAYSHEGKDRQHNPVICHAVAGKPEDREVRQTFELESAGAPIQQYRFGRTGDKQWVFHWHYTLFPPPDNKLDALQRFHQQLNSRPASLTVEVFSAESSDADAQRARDFVTLVDAAIREHLAGPHAVRGSQRTPMVVEEAPQGFKFEE